MAFTVKDRVKETPTTDSTGTVTQVAEFKGRISTKEFGNMLVNVATEYNEALLVIENVFPRGTPGPNALYQSSLANASTMYFGYLNFIILLLNS